MDKLTNFYQTVKSNKGVETELANFLKDVKEGKWEDEAQRIRAIGDKDKRGKVKADILPAITVSGTFEGGHSADNLKDHSGYIAMDFDDLTDVDKAFSRLKDDKYTSAIFKSVSGQGLCVLVRIVPSKHEEAFLGLERYYFTEYSYQVDQATKDVSRLRFVSYDPNLYTNIDAEKFTDYLPKKKGRKTTMPEGGYNGSDEDVEYIIEQIEEQKIDITANYRDWINIGFALKSEYGDIGEELYHRVSCLHINYSREETHKKWLSFSSDSSVGIGTFFYIAKQKGLDIKIPEDTVINEDEPTHKQLETWLKHFENIRYNELKNRCERNGIIADENMMNSAYFDAKDRIEGLSESTFYTMVTSDRVESCNPVKEYFSGLKGDTGTPIKDLAYAINSDVADADYIEHFLTKWLVGGVAMWHEDVANPLMLILVGAKQNTGKTHFFRHLLPPAIRDLMVESELTMDKDTKTQLCESILFLDDEMSVQGSRYIKTIKKLSSSENFTYRGAYGRFQQTRKRNALLCATTNDVQLLHDATGNRRLIPIQVNNIPHEGYNQVNKTELWHRAYQLYKGNYNWKLTSKDVKYLAISTEEFEAPNVEREMLEKYFKMPKNGDVEPMNTTEIKDYIEDRTNQKLDKRELGRQLNSLGYQQKSFRLARNDKSPRTMWVISTVDINSTGSVNEQPPLKRAG